MRDQSSQVVGAASAPAPHGPSSPSGRGPASVPRGSPTLMSALLAVLAWRCGVEVCCCSQLTQSGGKLGFMLR